MQELVGRTVLSYKMEEGGTKLTFTTDKGDIVYETMGDCCSSSFFSDIEGISNLIGNKVNSVEERQEWTEEETKKAEDQVTHD